MSRTVPPAFFEKLTYGALKDSTEQEMSQLDIL